MNLLHSPNKQTLVLLCVFFIGTFYGFAFSNAFEQYNKAGTPIWSTVFGCPVPHHYIIVFLLLGALMATLLYLISLERKT